MQKASLVLSRYETDLMGTNEDRGVSNALWWATESTPEEVDGMSFCERVRLIILGNYK